MSTKGVPGTQESGSWKYKAINGDSWKVICSWEVVHLTDSQERCDMQDITGYGICMYGTGTVLWIKKSIL